MLREFSPPLLFPSKHLLKEMRHDKNNLTLRQRELSKYYARLFNESPSLRSNPHFHKLFDIDVTMSSIWQPRISYPHNIYSPNATQMSDSAALYASKEKKNVQESEETSAAG